MVLVGRMGGEGGGGIDLDGYYYDGSFEIVHGLMDGCKKGWKKRD